ncbi:hypothetical protein EG327_010902 [Venturia inaequalis]|uniref:Calcineurin-like phosphoesterase domain-containing protein n=1 Tax=Venturia inaequalis TaxID=5025 RepID=A0A8H3VNV2_VENIN|nr:hypothetical protein EG327_010902 [Venturia inaequalis]
MSYAYDDLRPSRNNFHEPQGLTGQATLAFTWALNSTKGLWARKKKNTGGGGGGGGNAPRKSLLRRVFGLGNVLILLWVYVTYWGERTVFDRAIEECDWRHWESWPPEAQPHHVAFVADPQLVDPHTYPGRPWPLSTLTIWYTDIYLERVYRLMQERLYPDTTIFLGDLFDGGREWSVSGGERWDNPDKNFKRNGQAFWVKEYKRFSKIFFETFTKTGVEPRTGQKMRRKIISTLPGNHDLGFGEGVHRPVRNRFHAYFGEGNRVDVVGNHTFVSIDAVSISAKDPDHGRMNEDIWGSTMEFLDNVQATRKTAITRELKYQFGGENMDTRPRYGHDIVETDQLKAATLPTGKNLEDLSLPTILLSHVPLYRDAGTPCGPLREHWPPSKNADGTPMEKDDRNALSIARGYQYQNVISADLTKDITTKIGDIQYAFSGDDHDYCEVVHRRYPSGGGGIREFTEKSISWAMGVRKPGFSLLSLYNPIDANGKPIHTSAEETLQHHLCLMPDQLGIFINYILLLVFTLSCLLLRAGHMATNPQKSQFAGPDSPLLPTTYGADKEKCSSSGTSSDDGLTQNSYTDINGGKLASRPSAARKERSVSPLGGYGLPPPAHLQQTQRANVYRVPLVSHAGYYPDRDERDLEKVGVFVDKRKRLKGLKLFYAEFQWSVIKVAYAVLAWYGFLLYRG